MRIWAAGRSDLLSPVEAAEALLGLEDDTFWNPHAQRDLLFSLSRRWGGLPNRKRRRLERRLLRGPPQRSNEESSRDYRERKTHFILGRLLWLRDQGCAFGFDVEAKRGELRVKAPRRRDEYAANAARSLEGRSGWVRDVISAPGVLKPSRRQHFLRELPNSVDTTTTEWRSVSPCRALRQSNRFAFCARWCLRENRTTQ